MNGRQQVVQRYRLVVKEYEMLAADRTGTAMMSEPTYFLGSERRLVYADQLEL